MSVWEAHDCGVCVQDLKRLTHTRIRTHTYEQLMVAMLFCEHCVSAIGLVKCHCAATTTTVDACVKGWISAP